MLVLIYMEYNLPRKYLSYSAYTLWKSDKNRYRRKYYENDPEADIMTAEIFFGKTIAKRLESGDTIDGVIKYSNPEYRIQEELEPGLQILGYLDEFNDENSAIAEFKTGHLSKYGKVPWDNLKVRKHKQLVWYTMLVELKHGFYNPVVKLQWLETEFKKDTREFDGHTLEGQTNKLQLTGRVETFEREIKNWEIEKLKEDIILTAKEITEDYKLWKSSK